MNSPMPQKRTAQGSNFSFTLLNVGWRRAYMDRAFALYVGWISTGHREGSLFYVEAWHGHVFWEAGYGLLRSRTPVRLTPFHGSDQD
jgi:hypothetical protein